VPQAYTETVAHLTIREGGDPVGVIEPGKRFYASRNMSVSEAADQQHQGLVVEADTDAAVGAGLADAGIDLAHPAGEQARLTIREGGDPVGVIEPGKRFYASRNMSVSEAGLLTRGAGAPTRKRRSVRDRPPPSAITTAPSQISSTRGLSSTPRATCR
jgi:cytochrome c biogenesis factor